MVYDAHIDFPVPSVMIKEIGEALYICSFPKKGFVIVILYARRSRLTRRVLCTTLSPGELRRGGTIGALGIGQGTEARGRAKPSMLLSSTASCPEYGRAFSEAQALLPIGDRSVSKTWRKNGREYGLQAQ